MTVKLSRVERSSLATANARIARNIKTLRKTASSAGSS